MFRLVACPAWLLSGPDSTSHSYAEVSDEQVIDPFLDRLQAVSEELWASGLAGQTCSTGTRATSVVRGFASALVAALWRSWDPIERELQRRPHLWQCETLGRQATAGVSSVRSRT